MKNKLIDLNDHLFAQLERISDEDLKGEALETELKRSKAVSNLATSIINNARLALDAQVASHEYLIRNPPQMIGVEGYDEHNLH